MLHERFTPVTSFDDDYCWVDPTLRRRSCLLELEEQAKLNRQRRLKQKGNDDPQFRLARILHSSLNEIPPGQINVPLRYRLSRLGDQYQSQPDLYSRSLSPILSYDERNELILTAL